MSIQVMIFYLASVLDFYLLKGFSNVVKLLAPLTKNINAPCPDGLTPLEHASKNGHTDIEEFLIQTLSKKDSFSTSANNEDTDQIMEEINFDVDENSPSIAETLKTRRVSLSKPSSSSNPRCSR